MTMKTMCDDALGPRPLHPIHDIADFYSCVDCGRWFTHMELLQFLRTQRWCCTRCGGAKWRLINYRPSMLFSLRYWRYRKLRRRFSHPADIRREDV